MYAPCIRPTIAAPVIALALAATAGPAAAAATVDVSARINIVGSSGKPTNDVLGFGFSLHREVSRGWFVGLNLEHSPEFDFERPYQLVDRPSTREIDAVGSHLLVTLVGERRYRLGEKWTGFWNLGAGFNQIDMDDAAGDVVGGGTWRVETDIDLEFVLVGSVGWMQRLDRRWSVRYTLAAEHHSGDWEVVDRVSGNTGKIDDYAIYGLRVGLNYRF